MSKIILSTIFIRGLLAVLNFIIAILTTQYLGPEGKGDVSLFLLNLTIVQLLNNFVGGPYLVYLIPRKNTMQLIFPSYLWALFVSTAVPVILFLFHLTDSSAVVHLIIISVMYSFMSVNTMVMAGKEEISKNNITSLLQVLVLASAFFVYVDVFGIRDLSSYISAMYFSVSIALAVSFIFIIKYFEALSFSNMFETFSETLKKGFVVQAANITQLFNYRLSFYILDNYHAEGRREVGIYSVAVAVAEALWLISQSVALVLYPRISNLNDIFHARKITVASIKIVFLCTICATGFLLLLPPSFFSFVFGHGFQEVKSVLFPLSAGIIIFSIGIILSAYFVGTGRPHVSVVSAGIGLIVTVAGGFILIPEYGMMGAGITASISYIAGVVYQAVRFMNEAKEFNLSDFLFTRHDLNLVLSELKTILRPK